MIDHPPAGGGLSLAASGVVDQPPPGGVLSLASSGRGVAAIAEDQFIQKPPRLSIEITVIDTEKIVDADLERTMCGLCDADWCLSSSSQWRADMVRERVEAMESLTGPRRLERQL